MVDKAIAITGYKGGVGKTITAIHVASYFATRNRNPLQVLLVDGDANRSAKKWGASKLLPFQVGSEKEAVRMIDGINLLIIDTAARPKSEDLEEIASSADLIILPTKTGGISLNPTLDTYYDLSKACHKKMLICEVPSYPAKDGDELYLTLKKNGIEVFDSRIRRTKAFDLACEQGIYVKQVNHRGKSAWHDYVDLGKEIEKILEI